MTLVQVQGQNDNNTRNDAKHRIAQIKARIKKNGPIRNCEPCGGTKIRKKTNSRKAKADQRRRFRIVNGRKSMKSRPWMAFLLILGDNRCAGSLLNRRYILTAAHCVCVHFECPIGHDGVRTSGYDPKEDIKVYLGLKDLKYVFDINKRKSLIDNEYLLSKVIVHPKYNDALYDIALLRTKKEITFTEKIQPICLPFGPDFPDIRTDSIVAGWGTLKNTICHTNDNGPNPNSQCAFPFSFRGQIFQHCSFDSNPSADDRVCAQFRKDHPDVIANYKDEVLVFKDKSMKGPADHTCYFTEGGKKGWCGTCKAVSENEDDMCMEERWDPVKPKADKNWGWCNSLCTENQV